MSINRTCFSMFGQAILIFCHYSPYLPFIISHYSITLCQAITIHTQACTTFLILLFINVHLFAQWPQLANKLGLQNHEVTSTQVPFQSSRRGTAYREEDTFAINSLWQTWPAPIHMSVIRQGSMSCTCRAPNFVLRSTPPLKNLKFMII